MSNFEKPIANDSIITMLLSETFNKTVFIKYPSNQIDSFDISYDVHKNSCGSSAYVGRVWYSGYEIYTGNYNYFTIYK